MGEGGLKYILPLAKGKETWTSCVWRHGITRAGIKADKPFHHVFLVQLFCFVFCGFFPVSSDHSLTTIHLLFLYSFFKIDRLTKPALSTVVAKYINPFTVMMSLQKDQFKYEIWNPSAFLCSFSHWHVKRSSLKRIALKVDVIGQENLLFAGVSVHLSAQKFYRLGQWRG